jgi:prophage regulatory protein
MKKMNITDLVNDQKHALNEKIMRLNEVAYYLKLSKSTLYNHIRAGGFVTAILLGVRARGYLRSDVDAWIESRIKAEKVAA